MIVLKRLIPDPKILLLVSLFLKNGMMKSKQWIDKNRGIYQGDVLSPVLSNIYLNMFDNVLEKEGVDFVRFADDMIFFAHNEDEAKRYLLKASIILEKLNLNFGEDKSYIACIDRGFDFLGLYFHGKTVRIDNNRLKEKLTTLSNKAKKKDIAGLINFFNEYIEALKRYYLKALNDITQLILIEEYIDAILVERIAYSKKNKIINKKTKFIQLLAELDTLQKSTESQRLTHAKEIVSKAYESLALENPLQAAQKVIEKKKINVLQNQIKNSEIILNKYGLYVSINRGKVFVKEYGKVIKKIPINWVSRIIVMTKGASLSTALIHECSKKKIDIDFIDKQSPYAQITYFSTINNILHLEQINIKNADKGLSIAKEIVKSKIKNQTNLLKYHARYREKNKIDEFNILNNIIINITKIYNRVDSATSNAMLMGFEGSASASYWQGFAVLICKKDFKRETFNAPDAINQALNYGYAFIYHRVQSALLKRGVNIYHSFLHSTQANKPTLVYDMVEPFRQPVVDREIISILNLGTQIVSSKGHLNKESVRIITENIQERLATPTKWRKGKYKIVNIIEESALELSHVIGGTKKRFKGYVAKY
jgi:CRISPR-associated endonuclease Cas1